MVNRRGMEVEDDGEGRVGIKGRLTCDKKTSKVKVVTKNQWEMREVKEVEAKAIARKEAPRRSQSTKRRSREAKVGIALIPKHGHTRKKYPGEVGRYTLTEHPEGIQEMQGLVMSYTKTGWNQGAGALTWV